MELIGGSGGVEVDGYGTGDPSKPADGVGGRAGQCTGPLARPGGEHMRLTGEKTDAPLSERRLNCDEYNITHGEFGEALAMVQRKNGMRRYILIAST